MTANHPKGDADGGNPRGGGGGHESVLHRAHRLRNHNTSEPLKCSYREINMADEKVTIVEGRGGAGTAITVVVGIVAILAILYAIFGTDLLRNTPDKIDADVKVEAPKD